LQWLVLATLLALSPAAAVELWLSDDLSFWTAVSTGPHSETDAGRALRFEGDLAVIAANFRAGSTQKKVLLLGNSVIASNVVHSTIRALQPPGHQVAKAAVTRLTMLETAMLGPRLVAMAPDLVVLSMNRWDVAGTDGWEGLRWYDPAVAWRMSERRELMAHSSAHLSGLLNHGFILFRHRQPLLQRAGQRVGLPLDRMLNLAGGAPWKDQEVRSAAVPTVETRALQDLARQLRAADIRLLLISAPTRELSRAVPAGAPLPLAQQIQPGITKHLASLAREEGFAFAAHTDFRGFTPEMFADSIHLRHPGRALFTTQLWTMIEQADNAL
jgi:hypothetical protein